MNTYDEPFENGDGPVLLRLRVRDGREEGRALAPVGCPRI